MKSALVTRKRKAAKKEKKRSARLGRASVVEAQEVRIWVVPIPCEIPCPCAALIALGLGTGCHHAQNQGDDDAETHGAKDGDKASR
jgi:hypothetical protein